VIRKKSRPKPPKPKKRRDPRRKKMKRSDARKPAWPPPRNVEEAIEQMRARLSIAEVLDLRDMPILTGELYHRLCAWVQSNLGLKQKNSSLLHNTGTDHVASAAVVIVRELWRQLRREADLPV